MNILIAEDDFISRKLLRSILEEMGHQLTAAKDGEEALAIFESAPTRLVVLDWLMPKMDGIELVRRIRKREEGKSPSDYTYLIMLTANVGQRSSYYEAIEAGVDDFLAKPLERIELAARLRVAERILKAGSRIKSLENILTICAYTKKVKFPESGWQTIEEFMQRQLGISVSHGIEPTYYEQHIRPQIDALKQNNQNGR